MRLLAAHLPGFQIHGLGLALHDGKIGSVGDSARRYPYKRLILIRCGKRRGDLDYGWHMIFQDIARSF